MAVSDQPGRDLFLRSVQVFYCLSLVGIAAVAPARSLRKDYNPGLVTRAAPHGPTAAFLVPSAKSSSTLCRAEHHKKWKWHPLGCSLVALLPLPFTSCIIQITSRLLFPYIQVASPHSQFPGFPKVSLFEHSVLSSIPSRPAFTPLQWRQPATNYVNTGHVGMLVPATLRASTSIVITKSSQLARTSPQSTSRSTNSLQSSTHPQRLGNSSRPTNSWPECSDRQWRISRCRRRRKQMPSRSAR